MSERRRNNRNRIFQVGEYYNKYYDAFYILFHTGLRISEFCVLTVSDIEFEHSRIKVDHQLQRTSQMQYVIQEPKTEKGNRYVPMTDKVAACFRRIIKTRKKPRKEPMIDGYAGFLFLDKTDMPMVALHWEKYMTHGTTQSIVCNCPRSRPMCVGTPSAPTWLSPV